MPKPEMVTLPEGLTLYSQTGCYKGKAPKELYEQYRARLAEIAEAKPAKKAEKAKK